MQRTFILAAAAAALLALPAGAETLVVKTAGKSPAQIKAEVHQAAELACAREDRGAVFTLQVRRACVDDAVRTTLTRAAAAGAPITAD